MVDFEKIYNIYFKDVYYFVLSISKNKEIAEDITSETFFKALKNLNKFRGDSTIKTYLFQIAKNSYFDYIKKHNKIVLSDDMEKFNQVIQGVEVDFVNKEEESTLNLYLNKLKEPYQSIIKLRIWEELSFKEIGEIYNKSENWACVTFHRGKNYLRKILEENNEYL